MPTFRKLSSGKFQAIVRLKGLRPLHATFPTKTKAKKWAQAVEADTALARKLAVGDDVSLEQAVQVDTNTVSITCLVPNFSVFADEFLDKTQLADSSMIGRVKFWSDQFCEKLVIDVKKYLDGVKRNFIPDSSFVRFSFGGKRVTAEELLRTYFYAELFHTDIDKIENM